MYSPKWCIKNIWKKYSFFWLICIQINWILILKNQRSLAGTHKHPAYFKWFCSWIKKNVYQSEIIQIKQYPLLLATKRRNRQTRAIYWRPFYAIQVRTIISSTNYRSTDLPYQIWVNYEQAYYYLVSEMFIYWNLLISLVVNIGSNLGGHCQFTGILSVCVFVMHYQWSHGKIKT